MRQTIYIEVNNKKYPLVITPCEEKEDIEAGAIHVFCQVIGLNQGYLKEDLPLLLEDLPGMIEDKIYEKKDTNIPIRFSHKEKVLVQELASKSGYNNISSYVRAKALQV